LVVQKVLPADVPGVIVQQDNPPLRHRLFLALALPCPPVDDHGLGRRAAIDQCPRLARIMEHLLDTMLAGPAPADVLAHGPRADLRQRQRRLTLPEHRWSGTAQGPKFLEDACDGVLDLTISAFFHAIVRRPHASDGAFPHHMPALDFGFKGLARPLAPAAQRLFRHRALHPQPQAVVELPRVIDAVIVDEQGLGQRPPIDQMMPVAVLAG
jgi:hypothetical protein